MTKAHQIAFVREISKSVSDSIVKQIRAGKIPDTWDGHELRVLIEERHKLSAGMSIIRRDGRSRRAMAYRNTVLINSLL